MAGSITATNFANGSIPTKVAAIAINMAAVLFFCLSSGYMNLHKLHMVAEDDENIPNKRITVNMLAISGLTCFAKCRVGTSTLVMVSTFRRIAVLSIRTARVTSAAPNRVPYLAIFKLLQEAPNFEK